MKELAGSEVRYEVAVRSLRKRVVPDLDDEFAKDLGEFDSLAALEANGWNRQQTADALKINRTTLYSRMESLQKQ